ncbi:PD-(D/E)XK nuclease family protein [Fenollaria timonensis]|uniref:PD-(D/E)XK nuclease family protein n=1 Tax=Fenollaria timonensis TaxID=1723384 RepID=UPI00071C6AED|nr:PD-(D/E)XK nuclease family protein [Fenollaria timonensis]
MMTVYETKKDVKNLFSTMQMDEGGKTIIITKNTEYKDFIVQEGLKRLGALVNTSVLSVDDFYLREAKGNYKFLSELSMRLIIKQVIEMNKGEMPFLNYPSYMDLIFEAIKDASANDIDLLEKGGEYKKIYEDYEAFLKKGGYLGMNESVELDDLKIKEAKAIYFIGFNEMSKKLMHLIDMAKKFDKNVKFFIEEDFASDELVTYLKEKANEFYLDDEGDSHFEKISKNLFNKEITHTAGINFVRADSIEAELDYALTDIKEKVLKDGYAYGDALIYIMDKSEERALMDMLGAYEMPVNKNSVFHLRDLVWQDKLFADIAASESPMTSGSLMSGECHMPSEYHMTGESIFERINTYTADEMLLDKFKKIIAAIEDIYGKAISKEKWIELLKLAFKYEVYREKDRLPFGISIYSADFDTLRHYKLIYIIGMNMDSFPKSMSENFLLDNIYAETGFDKKEKMSRLSKNLMKKLFKAADEKITMTYSARTSADADQGASSFFNEFHIDEWISVKSLGAIEKSASHATSDEQKKFINAYKNIGPAKFINYDEINKLRAEGVISKYNGKLESYSAMSVVDDFVKNKLTVSFLETFKTCPYAALLGYIYGIEPAEVDMKARNIGTYMHKVLELYYRNFIGEKVIYDEALLDRTMSMIKKTNEYADVYGFELENIESYIKDFIVFDEERMKNSNYIVKEVEKMITIDVDGYKIKGKIDRVDEDTLSGKLLVLDYKKSNYINKDSLQLSAYALYYKHSGVDIDAAFITMTKLNGKLDIKKADADACEEEIRSLLEKLKTYSFNIIDEASDEKCLVFCDYRCMCKKGRE